MEEGSLRCDANISVRLKGSKELRNRVEVKNLNSFSNVQKAIDLERDRQITAYEKGEKIEQETRTYNAKNNSTIILRKKEDAQDKYIRNITLVDFNNIPKPFVEKFIEINQDYFRKL